MNKILLVMLLSLSFDYAISAQDSEIEDSFESPDGQISADSMSSREFDASMCSICHDNIDAVRSNIELTCKHVFHESCIQLWFDQPDSQDACPICRTVYVVRENERKARFKNRVIAMLQAFVLSVHGNRDSLRRSLVYVQQECISLRQEFGESFCKNEISNMLMHVNCAEIIQSSGFNVDVQRTIDVLDAFGSSFGHIVANIVFSILPQGISIDYLELVVMDFIVRFHATSRYFEHDSYIKQSIQFIAKDLAPHINRLSLELTSQVESQTQFIRQLEQDIQDGYFVPSDIERAIAIRRILSRMPSISVVSFVVGIASIFAVYNFNKFFVA